MEIVSKPDLRSADEAKAYVSQAAHDPALSRHLRRRHGEGQPARRRQRLGAQAGRRRSARAARSRTSTRSASSARRSSTRRAARSTSSRTAARSSRRRGCSIPTRARRARCAPRRRRTTTATSPIPTCCRSSSTQAYVDELEGASAGTAGREEGALHARLRAVGLRRRRAGRRARDAPTIFEAVAKGRDAKAAANWVINELFGRLNKEGKEIAASPVSPAQLGAILDLIGDGHDLRQDRQGPVRDRLERGRRSARDRRGARHEAGHRPRRDREGGRRDHRREPGQGRAGARPSRS